MVVVVVVVVGVVVVNVVAIVGVIVAVVVVVVAVVVKVKKFLPKFCSAHGRSASWGPRTTWTQAYCTVTTTRVPEHGTRSHLQNGMSARRPSGRQR